MMGVAYSRSHSALEMRSASHQESMACISLRLFCSVNSKRGEIGSRF